jgi:RNA polymerase sigma factor (sigma-70 family)
MPKAASTELLGEVMRQPVGFDESVSVSDATMTVDAHNSVPVEYLERKKQPITPQATFFLRSAFDCTLGALEGVAQYEAEEFAEKVIFPKFREVTKLSSEMAEERIEEALFYITGTAPQAVLQRISSRTELSLKGNRRHLLSAVHRGEEGYDPQRLRSEFSLLVGRETDWVAVGTKSRDVRTYGKPKQDTTNLKETPQQRARQEAETVHSGDSVGQYLNEIGKIALLDQKEEIELAKRIEAGLYAGHLLSEPDTLTRARKRDLRTVTIDGERAKDQLLRANLRLVVPLAKRYSGKGVPFLDLIQEGNTGLIRAVERFDYTKGFKFSTYATWWVRQAIDRYRYTAGQNSLPIRVALDVSKLQRVHHELFDELGRDATAAEIAQRMDKTQEKVEELVGFSRRPVSLDQTVTGRSDFTLGSLIGDEYAQNGEAAAEATLMREQLHEQLGGVLETLKSREAAVLRLRYGLDGRGQKSFKEVGEYLNLSARTVSQIERDAITKLNDPERADGLRDYYE